LCSHQKLHATKGWKKGGGGGPCATMKYVATKEQEHQLLLMMMLLVATSLVANLHNNVEEKQSTAKPGHLSVRMYLCIFVSLYLCITEPRDVCVHLQQHQQSINPRTQAPVDSCAILCINAWA